MSGPRMSPEVFRARLHRVATALLPDLGRELEAVVFALWATGQIGRMRDAAGEPRRRRADDAGPLRIVSGRYSRTTSDPREGIRRMDTEGVRLRFTKGYALAQTPQAHNETGTRYAPARPTLGPGLRDALPGMVPMIRRRFRDGVRAIIRGAEL